MTQLQQTPFVMCERAMDNFSCLKHSFVKPAVVVVVFVVVVLPMREYKTPYRKIEDCAHACNLKRACRQMEATIREAAAFAKYSQSDQPHPTPASDPL